MGLALQPAARRDLVDVAVNVDLQQRARRAHDVIVRDDILQQTVGTLNIGLAEVASALLNNKAVCDRLIRVLGVGNKSNASAPV